MPIAISVTAIVVTYESAVVLARCLESLAGEGVKAIVVDNASSDESIHIAREAGAEVIVNTENLGFGCAMNKGVRAAVTEYCLLINPDATVEKNCISTLLAAAHANPNAAIIAPEIREPDGRVFFHETSLLSSSPRRGEARRGALRAESSLLRPLPNPPPQGEGIKEVSFVSGACMLIRREWFLNIGGFDEKIFLFYEDDDLCRRAIDAGRDILYVPEAKILHLRGKSVAPSLRHIYTVRYHQAYSRAYVCRKYGIPHPAFRLLLISCLKSMVAIMCMNKKKIARQWGSVRGHMYALFYV